MESQDDLRSLLHQMADELQTVADYLNASQHLSQAGAAACDSSDLMLMRAGEALGDARTTFEQLKSLLISITPLACNNSIVPMRRLVTRTGRRRVAPGEHA